MVFLILIYLVLVALPLPWPAPLLGGGVPASLTATAILTMLPIVGAWQITRRTSRQLRALPVIRDEILFDYARSRTRNLFALIACHGMAITLFGWGWAVRQMFGANQPIDQPFGAELLLILPFVVALLSSWAVFYSAEKTAAEVSFAGLDVDEPYGGRWSYVVFLARQHLALVSIPLGLFVIEQGLVRTFRAQFADGKYRFALVGLTAIALVLAPWALRVLLRTSRLPAGPIRDRLEAAARRLRLRYSDILLWHTHGGVANAMVAGPLPWVRYIFLSDRLLDSLPPDEVEAVFGHEVGHVRHGHFLFYILFIALSLFALAGLWEVGLTAALGERVITTADDVPFWLEWQEVPEIALVGAYMFVAFGFLSRRCERQADLFGCRAVSCTNPHCTGHSPQTELAPDGRTLCPSGIRTFIRALDRVAALNGISRGRPGWLQSWLHSTIALRVNFLEQVIADPTTAVRFQRRVGVIKWGVIGLLAAVFGGLIVTGFWDKLCAAL